MRRVLCLLCLVYILAACGSGETPAERSETMVPATVPAEYAGLTNPLGAEAAADGESVFQSNCATCHGPQGHGDGPAGQALDPRPRNLAALQATVGDDFLYWRIHDGVSGTSMVAWKGILTEEQIWQAVAYIRTLK